jgi:hypothetical protein
MTRVSSRHCFGDLSSTDIYPVVNFFAFFATVFADIRKKLLGSASFDRA